MGAIQKELSLSGVRFLMLSMRISHYMLYVILGNLFFLILLFWFGNKLTHITTILHVILSNAVLPSWLDTNEGSILWGDCQ